MTYVSTMRHATATECDEEPKRRGGKLAVGVVAVLQGEYRTNQHALVLNGLFGFSDHSRPSHWLCRDPRRGGKLAIWGLQSFRGSIAPTTSARSLSSLPPPHVRSQNNHSWHLPGDHGGVSERIRPGVHPAWSACWSTLVESRPRGSTLISGADALTTCADRPRRPIALTCLFH